MIGGRKCKRRWASEAGRDAGDGWCATALDRCEARELWYQHVDGLEQPRPLTTAQLADELRRDADVLTVANLYTPGQESRAGGDRRPGRRRARAAPGRAALQGLRAGQARRLGAGVGPAAAGGRAARRGGEAGVPQGHPGRPPKYTSADFLKTSYWRHRGKLDVPKERFVSYPGCQPRR